MVRVAVGRPLCKRKPETPTERRFGAFQRQCILVEGRADRIRGVIEHASVPGLVLQLHKRLDARFEH